MTTASPQTITDLIRFLMARVDDDDDQLKHEVRVRARATEKAPAPKVPGIHSLDRLRAENDAKREVIASAQQLLVLRDQPAEKPVRDNAAQILRAMAYAYSDHPSFRREWHR